MDEMVAWAINKTGLENREIQLRRTDDFLPLPFCGVIFRVNIRTDVQVTHQHKLFHVSMFSRADSRACAFHVQSIKCLIRIFHACPCTVDDCLTAFEGRSEFIRIVCVNGKESSALHGLRVPRIVSTCNDDDFMPASNQIPRHMSADKTSSTRYRDFHNTPLVTARSREPLFAKRYPE